MATGSGKSLTFQIPVIHARRRLGRPKATTFVISPLVSLMEDQVQALHGLGVSACSLQAGCGAPTYSRALRGEFALVYVTPERLVNMHQQLSALHERGDLLSFAV